MWHYDGSGCKEGKQSYMASAAEYLIRVRFTDFSPVHIYVMLFVGTWYGDHSQNHSPDR